MSKWTEEELVKHNASRLKKIKCPSCGYVNPIMQLINTANCMKCGTFNDIVENEFFIISNSDWTVLDEEKKS